MWGHCSFGSFVAVSSLLYPEREVVVYEQGNKSRVTDSG